MRDDRREECECGFRQDRVRRMRRGNTLAFTVTVLQDVQTGEYGTAWPGEAYPPNTLTVDLTGWCVVFTAKYELPDWDSEAVAQLDNQSLGGVSTPGTSGAVNVSQPPQDTQGFPDSDVTLVYDVTAVDPSGGVHTAETGRLVVEPSATRLSGNVPTGGVLPSVIVPPNPGQISYATPRVLVDATNGPVALIFPTTGLVDGEDVTIVVYRAPANSLGFTLSSGSATNILNPQTGALATSFTPQAPASGESLQGQQFVFFWSQESGEIEPRSATP